MSNVVGPTTIQQIKDSILRKWRKVVGPNNVLNFKILVIFRNVKNLDGHPKSKDGKNLVEQREYVIVPK